MHTQLVVLGGGPGGYAAAFRAADLGMEVTIVEQDSRLGGTCLLRGCIPSKSLLHSTDLVAQARDAAEWGIEFAPPRIDIVKLRERTAQAVAALTDGLTQIAKARKVKVVQARGTFLDSKTLMLTGGNKESYKEDTLTFDQCILASGSRPIAPAALRLDSPLVMDSTAALDLPEVPKALLVVGGGYIGLELGSVYANLGARVTLVELTDGLLPGVDRDLVRPLQKRLERLFAEIRLGTSVTGLSQADNAVDVTFAPSTLTQDNEPRPQGSGHLQEPVASVQSFDRVLVCVGRRPCSDNLGLENTKVQLDGQGFVEVDKSMRTADPYILAIGDVAGGPMLAHKATHEGKIAAEVAAGHNTVFAPRDIPAVVFTDPQIAWAGLTEEEARARNVEVKVSRYPWAASGRAQGIGRTEGATKMLLDPATDRILGVGIVGADAGDLVSEAVLAIQMGATAADLANTIHPHPTLSETLGAAAEVYLGLSTEIYRPRKKE